MLRSEENASSKGLHSDGAMVGQTAMDRARCSITTRGRLMSIKLEFYVMALPKSSCRQSGDDLIAS